MLINPPKVEGNEALFQIAPSLYQHSWEYYYRQYEKVTHYFICRVYQGRDVTFLRRLFQPIMFLLRHNIELMLKANRVAIGMNINDDSHNLTAQKINHLPEDFFGG